MNNNNNNQVQQKTSCWSEKIIPLVAMYMVICTMLYITGALDPRGGPGLNLHVLNLIAMTVFAGCVMMNPKMIYVGGCD